MKRRASLSAVMAGHSRPKDGVASARLCPAIHVGDIGKKDVDARDKPGHDERDVPGFSESSS
jgi:hypothetical protein